MSYQFYHFKTIFKTFQHHILPYSVVFKNREWRVSHTPALNLQ
ncbi:hypothetical protein KE3_1703 [Streptococcus lutetiensis 033]|uniref:Transposase n=1 Tax=Streptococcus lutetiensis 033 TaxID=1076934 RepID=A0AB33ANP1_9STRE|nr:hypothetical protein KE3_1703 [Streptococcus lutetiensis 033]